MPNCQNLTSRRWKPNFWAKSSKSKSEKWPYGAINILTLERAVGKDYVLLQNLKVHTLTGNCGAQYWEWNCQKGWVKGGPDGTTLG